jgi:hypothetical protein
VDESEFIVWLEDQIVEAKLEEGNSRKSGDYTSNAYYQGRRVALQDVYRHVTEEQQGKPQS